MHPFDPAPYRGTVRAIAGWPLAVAGGSALAASDAALIRGLRPEALATWVMTLGSAVVSVVLYAALWGPAIACGLVAGMWVHELGHRLIARRLGLELAPIVFVPFIGAMQRLRQAPSTGLDGAALALAGPLCGLWFALGCKLLFVASGDATLRLLGTAHALLALIDLLPFGPLDGGRIVRAVRAAPRMPVGGQVCVGMVYLSLVVVCVFLA